MAGCWIGWIRCVLPRRFSFTSFATGGPEPYSLKPNADQMWELACLLPHWFCSVFQSSARQMSQGQGAWGFHGLDREVTANIPHPRQLQQAAGDEPLIPT